jgi:hypothetical protein
MTGTIRAWWPKKRGAFMHHRAWLRFHGYNWDIELNDKLVQGEAMETLIALVEGWIAEKEEYLARSDSCLKRDRYGEIYPDYEISNAICRTIAAFNRRLEAMKNGTWCGPTHIIQTDSNGNETVEPWVG